MLIKWDQAGPLSIAKGESMIVLIPGVNEIADADWSVCAKNPGVVRFINDKKLEVIGQEADAPPGDLSEMNAPEAIEVVKTTYRMDLLTKWLELETRKGVGAAIADQIETMKVKSKDEEALK